MPTPAQLLVIGSLNLDLLLHVEQLPRAGETRPATAFVQNPGGKGANQAVAAARLGAATTMLGAVGQDAAGDTLLGALRSAGVDTAAIPRLPGPSGTALVFLLPSGQNSIVIAAGANGSFSPEHLQPHRDKIGSAGLILIQLETSMEILSATLGHAGATPVMLDPAPAATLPREVLEQLAWFTPNESEARFYAGHGMLDDLFSKTGTDCGLDPAAPSASSERGLERGVSGTPHVVNKSAARALCIHLQSLGPRNILLKLGGYGAGILLEDGEWHFASAPQVQVVDTTGAGDTLNAAFATALLRGDSAALALPYAVAAASLSVTRAGAMDACPTREELEAFLAAQKAE